jgi:hypothetical protein
MYLNLYLSNASAHNEVMAVKSTAILAGIRGLESMLTDAATALSMD